MEIANIIISVFAFVVSAMALWRNYPPPLATGFDL